MTGNSNDIMLQVKELEVVYHHVSTAIQGVSFDVEKSDKGDKAINVVPE